MDVRNKIVVVTGAAGGIGTALCRRFARERAAAVVVSDRDVAAARSVADEIDGLAIGCNVANEDDVRELVEATLAEFGRIDLFVSNAGVTQKGGVELPTDGWQRMWDVHVMGHVFAARAVLPHMLARGEGYLVNLASAAGLLTEMGSAAYTVTKHAAVALAEWLSIEHHAAGIRSSCVCPMGVATDFLDDGDPIHRFLAITAVTPEDVAESVIRGLREELFLILPHADVAEYFAGKGADYERYLKGFRRLREKLRVRRAA